MNILHFLKYFHSELCVGCFFVRLRRFIALTGRSLLDTTWTCWWTFPVLDFLSNSRHVQPTPSRTTFCRHTRTLTHKHLWMSAFFWGFLLPNLKIFPWNQSVKTRHWGTAPEHLGKSAFSESLFRTHLRNISTRTTLVSSVFIFQSRMELTELSLSWSDTTNSLKSGTVKTLVFKKSYEKKNTQKTDFLLWLKFSLVPNVDCSQLSTNCRTLCSGLVPIFLFVFFKIFFSCFFFGRRCWG